MNEEDFKNRRILVMGLSGAGKTTLATLIAKSLGAVHFNADEVRANINKDLGFSVEDRVEQARRMGWLVDQVAAAGVYAVADFICPTRETRAAFGPCFTVWVEGANTSRYADTNALFEPPENFNLRTNADNTPEYWTEKICTMLRG